MVPSESWTRRQGRLARTLLPDDFGYGVSAVAWSPDGTRIVAFSGDKLGRVWNAETGQELASFAGVDTGVAAEWSPTGDRFMVGGFGGGVYVWDAASLDRVAFYPP